MAKNELILLGTKDGVRVWLLVKLVNWLRVVRTVGW